MNSSLQIQFDGKSSALDSTEGLSPFIKLEQEELSDELAQVSSKDLWAMYHYVIVGKSAKEYYSEDCPCSITEKGVKLWLYFYVFPSSPDIEYTLEANRSEEDYKITIFGYGSTPKSVNAIIPSADSVLIDYAMEDAEVVWLTPCYSPEGSVINKPTMKVSGRELVFSKELFSVIKVYGTAKYQKYKIEIDLSYDGEHLADNPNLRAFVSGDFSTTITAYYKDADGEEVTATLDLEIPGCVEGLLGTCLDSDSGGGGSVLINSKRYKRHYRVKYSTCTGRVVRAEWVNEEVEE